MHIKINEQRDDSKFIMTNTQSDTLKPAKLEHIKI